MISIVAESIGRAVSRCHARMTDLEVELNAADARLGDGDTGVMLSRVVAGLDRLDYGSEGDIGKMFALMARTTATATGSSLGTLFATGMLSISNRTKGQTCLDWHDIGPHLNAAVVAMMARGGAKLGDKTVLDILQAIANSVSGLSDAKEITVAAKQSAAATLAEFRNKPCRAGRARMFADRSVGVDDPGMLAIFRLLDAIAIDGESR